MYRDRRMPSLRGSSTATATSAPTWLRGRLVSFGWGQGQCRPARNAEEYMSAC